MGYVTTRAAARRMAEAEAARSRLLDLPPELLDRILIDASGGGRWGAMRAARLACRRLQAAADAAAAALSLRVAARLFDGGETLAQAEMLERLGKLARLKLALDYECEDDPDARGFVIVGDEDKGGFEDCVQAAEIIGNAIKWDDHNLADLWIRGNHPDNVAGLALELRLLAARRAGAPQQPPPPRVAELASLSLAWPGPIRLPLAPLAQLTRLTALELRGYASGARKADWLPPNIEELHLGAYGDWCNIPGVGGAGWLAALHAGACPRLRALRLAKLAARDYLSKPGLSLGLTLPRLTRLEELVVTARESPYLEDYHTFHSGGGSYYEDEGWTEDEDDGEGEDDGDDMARGAPIPAAPLLAALPNLRHCDATFVRMCHDRDQEGSLRLHCHSTPMLLATPAELAALRAPRLESLAVGLVASPDIEGGAWRCSDCYSDDGSDGDSGSDDEGGVGGAAQGGGAAGGAAGNAPANAAAAAAAAGTAAAAAAAGAGSSAGPGLPALRSLELYVGCFWATGGRGDLWDLSALAPGSLPALRRLLVLPICFECCRAKLPLSAVARAAPGLERLVIDPRCAGPLWGLFEADGHARVLRWLGVLPANTINAATPARIDAELRAGLRKRAAASRRSSTKASRIKVTVFGKPLKRPPQRAGAPKPYPRGASVVRRSFDKKDGAYIGHFLHTGLRRGSLPASAREDMFGVDAYERRGRAA